MFDDQGFRRIPDGIQKDNLKDIIETRVTIHPQRLASNFLHNGEIDSQDPCSYAELDWAARRILHLLHSAGVQQGDRVLLLFPAGNRFIQAFIACIYGGIVAVPAALPGRKDADWQRVYGMARDCEAAAMLSSGEQFAKLESRFSREYRKRPDGNPFLRIDADGAFSGSSVAARTATIAAGDLAFLQYTSGSTGAPKGVMVSHANLLHNQRVLQTGFKNDGDTRYVSWLPLFHDMGLIGCALQSLYLGAPFNFMAPAAFLQQPLRWLKAIDHFGATTSGAPNFAYALCADRYSPTDCRNLQLDSWRCAFNGAEPVRPSTLEKFRTAYSPHGYREDAMLPCYGLAEGVLMVSGNADIRVPTLLDLDREGYLKGEIKKASSGRPETTMVGVGQVVGDQQVAIVDPDTRRRTDGDHIGEIWLHGGSVAAGYWGKAQETRATFQAAIEGESPDRTYLRTGDSGFLDARGELYITARIKDTIIVNGRNYFPQDIELVVEQADPALKPGGSAVFSIDREGEERIVVVQEIHRTALKSYRADSVIKAIRAAVARECELNVYDVCLLRPTTLLKTTSGKVQRQRNKQAYLHGELSLLDQLRQAPAAEPPQAADADAILQAIRDYCQQHLETTAPVEADELFIDVGLTSVDAVGLAEYLSRQLQRPVDAALFWQYPEVGDFCSVLGNTAHPAPHTAADRDLEQLSGTELRRQLERELS